MLRAELGNARERRLLKRFRALEAVDRDTLEAFAEFLAQRQARTEGELDPDENIGKTPTRREPRPTEESVIAAMQRLRRSYPELDAGDLLNDASLLMSAHMLQGRPAAAVIDELEQLFARHAGECDLFEPPAQPSAFDPPDAESVLSARGGFGAAATEREAP